MHDVHNYVSECGVAARGVDTRYGLSLSNSVAQSVPTRSTAAVPCFHGKFVANWRAKFVHCHVHLWCLLYESVRIKRQLR